MTDFVLRHPNLPDQPIVVCCPDGQTPADEYSNSGWVIDTKTTPADLLAKDEPAEPVKAVEVSPEAPDEPEPASLDLTKPEN